MKYELYGALHKSAKTILHKGQSSSAYRMINVDDRNILDSGTIDLDGEPIGSFINEYSPVPETLQKSDVYPIENIVQSRSFPSFNDSFEIKRKCSEKDLGVKTGDEIDSWLTFINSSRISDGFRNAALHYAGYILDAEEWCLPSWIWTNAAIVRMYCAIGKLEEARELTDKLLSYQQACGGWIVRNDYDAEGAVPILAPNDSAYIANNACLETYIATRDLKYLDAAIKCAEWIEKTARKDGMVYKGYDVKRSHWQMKSNIVDVGFTAGLFARLYAVCGDARYLSFLKRFTEKYIDLFYIPTRHGFATGLDENDHRLGGMFGRGQAWALEGLIPAFEVLKDQKIEEVINDTVLNLVNVQDKTGGWAYNLTRPLMGIDCKATPIIAVSLMRWLRSHPECTSIKNSAEKAYNWCIRHTMAEGSGQGGIFSYTTEGAIVHHMYTWTSFAYSSAYAIELNRLLSEVN